MRNLEMLKRNIKTFSFFFTFIALIYPIKALFAFMENGLGFQYLWPNLTSLNQYLPAVTPSLLMISFFSLRITPLLFMT